MPEAQDFQQRIQKIEALVHQIEALGDGAARKSALELFQLIMDLHGAGLERMMSITFEAGEAGAGIIDSLARDDLVGSLLLLYGLHPLDLHTRVTQALDNLRPQLGAHGGRVDLLEIADGVVRLRFEASRNGCGSSARDLRQLVEAAIADAAPDMAGLEVESVEPPLFASGLVQLTKSPVKNAASQPAGLSLPGRTP